MPKELGISDSSLPPKQVLSAIGRAKDELIGPEEYESMYAGDFGFPNKQYIRLLPRQAESIRSP
jgi:hypothetical protein